MSPWRIVAMCLVIAIKISISVVVAVLFINNQQFRFQVSAYQNVVQIWQYCASLTDFPEDGRLLHGGGFSPTLSIASFLLLQKGCCRLA